MLRFGSVFLVLLVVITACNVSRDLTESPTNTPEPTEAATETPSSTLTPVTPASNPTDTPLPTPSFTPTPTGVFIHDEPIIFEKLPDVDPLTLDLDATSGLIAYQQDRQLWLNNGDLTGVPAKVTACGELDNYMFCLPQIHWSPDEAHFYYQTAVNYQHQLIISDLQGQQQGFSTSTTPYRDPVWSPDGRQLILFIDTNRPWGDHLNGDMRANEFGFVKEVWQLQIDEDGIWSAPQKLTEIEAPGIGCGGGGRSYSDYLYESQYGFTLGLNAAQKMFWTADDVIIYHLACDGTMSQGFGRYDVNANQQLEPYPGHLHGLTLDSSGSRWYAITGSESDDISLPENQLVTGTAADISYEWIETAVSVEMVFVGAHSGRLYYTARELLEHKDLTEQVDDYGEPYFNFYHTQLWTIQPDGSDERLLWESADHSYSRIAEASDGDVLFVLIENDVVLYEAMLAGISKEEREPYLPHTHVMRLSTNSAEPEIWIEDARDLAVWFPQ